MSRARLIRRKRFRAAHHYGLKGLSGEENRGFFGVQAESHEHLWTVEVRVSGPVDPETGFVVDLASLDAALAEATAGWDGGDLNALVPEVARGEMQPSTEALARWLHGRLEGAVAEPVRLDGVAVFESDDLGAEYPAR